MVRQINRRPLKEHRTDFLSWKKTGMLLRLEELTAEEAEMVSKEFFSRIRGKELSTEHYYAEYLSILHSWGIMCPHPQELRSYELLGRQDTPIPFDESRWYGCGMCNSIVLNR